MVDIEKVSRYDVRGPGKRRETTFDGSSFLDAQISHLHY